MLVNPSDRLRIPRRSSEMCSRWLPTGMRVGCRVWQPLAGGLIALFLCTSMALALPPRTPVVSIGTGIDRATNLPFASGAQDTNYPLTTVPSASPPNLAALIGTHPTVLDDVSPPLVNTYVKGSSASRWLGMINSVYQPNSYHVLQGNPYTFLTSVLLSPAEAPTAQIDGLRTAVDNKLIAIRVNGTDVYTAPVEFAEEFRSFKEFPDGVGAGLFQAGSNTIEFVTDNWVSAPSPLAIRFEGQVTAAVPEPSGCLLLGAVVPLLAQIRKGRGKRDNRSRSIVSCANASGA